MRNPRIGQELLDVPMGEMIREMAFAIADAQMRLDENSIDVAQMMGGLKTITRDFTNEEGEQEQEITFKDSRVFFGKEKVSVSDAVTIYNTTNDVGLKNQIYQPKTTTPKFAGVNADLYKKKGTDEIELTTSGTPSVTEIFIPQRLSMLELGFSPTFYQFVDTIIEVKISIKYTRSGSSSYSYSRKRKTGGVKLRGGFLGGSLNYNVSTTQVNASYSQKYSYSAEGSSLLRTKLVPIPPPAILEERIQQQMEIAMAEKTATETTT